MFTKFDDLLNKSLPSKQKSMEESADDLTLEFGDDDDDIDNIDDTELDSELDAINIDDIDTDDVTEDELAAISDDEAEDDGTEEELDADEAHDADAMMGLVATPVLLDDELKDEATMEAFINEFPIAVTEGLLLESDADEFFESSVDDLFTEKKIFANKTRVQLDEKDRRKQLFEVGVQASARAKNDPLYWKLQKCYKLERTIKAKLRQKYRGEALKRVKAYIKRLKSSSSSILSALGKKITGK